MAGSWLIASVYIERMTQIRPRTWAVHGEQVFIQHAALAGSVNLYFDGAMGNRAWPEVMVVRRWPLRTLSGRSLSYHSCIIGLWSNRSIWEGPPTMCR
jgi:hypothetical protein